MSAATISMRDFFALPVVKTAQEIQKQNAFGSAEHRAAFQAIQLEAAKYGVLSFIGEYEQ